MKKYGLVFMAGICLAVLVFGHLHWKNMSQAAGIEGEKAEERIKEKEKEEREALIQSLKPENNKQQSLIDYLQYKSLTQDKVIVSLVGSNGTSGTGASNTSNSWAGRLEKSIRSERDDLESIGFFNHGHEGYSTKDLLEGEKIDEVIHDNPDLVIFEDSLINNHYQSISLEQTEKDLINIMLKLQKELPNAKILIISPNPVANSKTENNLELNYLDYIKASERVLNKNKWTYIDSIEGIEKKLKEENIRLADILTNDNVHPNDQGHYIWFEVLYEFFMGKVVS
ncbi:SGNH/GDSL hydrolase family protein [Bacillus sp. ISL-4]|uniref:SGNH/GDSL hydrolase family protein n=1 Tax=Bacillus sp. ISL-4 TaxID=2819125 RepID=UPI001BECB973|nr:SGNH/GDSL hydrolase family protein [Bacillus sp. ISL-4]MBT2667499.1 SGNH/GDSL hydrolase family protein [Bacillus sp. ISL-4]MBT2672962.1 SGNH/GDSL hydrolase family protein [Streptomyces sp. ISL-14]